MPLTILYGVPYDFSTSSILPQCIELQAFMMSTKTNIVGKVPFFDPFY